MKNTLEEINTSLGEADNWISNLEDKEKEKRIKKSKDSLRNLWDNKKHNDVHIIGVPEGEEGEQGFENLFKEIMTKNFLNMVKEKRHTSLGSTESPKQDEPKEAHTEQNTS